MTITIIITIELIRVDIMKQAYGNSHRMLMFEVNINEWVVWNLVTDGYLEEGDFDAERYYEETDSDYARELAQPVLDALLDFYEDKGESEYEDGGFDDCDIEKLDEMDTLDFMMLYCDIFDNLRGAVKVYWVDPANPYNL